MVKFGSRVRKFVKRGARAVGKLAKKRYAPKGKLAMGQIVKDVMMLKKLVNVEKKRFDLVASSASIAQVNGLSSNAFYVQDLTPIPISGSGYNQRSGASIKIVSGFMKLQVWQQINNNHTMKFRLELWKVKGETVTPSNMVSQLYLLNQANGLIDSNSLRNPDYFGDAKKILTKSFTLKSQFSNDVAITDVKIPIKLQHHVRYDTDTTTVVDGQIFMLILADSGNKSSSVVSTTPNIPITAINSGALFNQDIKWYFVDN